MGRTSHAAAERNAARKFYDDRVDDSIGWDGATPGSGGARPLPGCARAPMSPMRSLGPRRVRRAPLAVDTDADRGDSLGAARVREERGILARHVVRSHAGRAVSRPRTFEGPRGAAWPALSRDHGAGADGMRRERTLFRRDRGVGRAASTRATHSAPGRTAPGTGRLRRVGGRDCSATRPVRGGAGCVSAGRREGPRLRLRP